MVSLWPWKGEDNSPAHFEKTLAALSTKINDSTARLDTHRQNARRFKALWTLYTTFAYLLYSIILALVLGWQNWGIVEYSAVSGGPVLIYVVRTLASRFFDYRISKTQQHLDDLNKQRDTTIEKLKAATKYNSTQQLLEKYGGESPKPSPSKSDDEKPNMLETLRKPSTPQQQPVARTGLAPPPTANIRRRPVTPSAPSPSNPSPPPPYGTQTQPRSLPQTPPQPPLPQQPVNEPGFAPNAFPRSSQYIEQSHWYDRLLDVLLGEDETQPKNRVALICRACRLVNGQAPPGVRTLEEIGRWRCGGCGAWNGEESEATKVLANIRNSQSSAGESTWEPVSRPDADSYSFAGDAAEGAVMVPASDPSPEASEGGPAEEDEEPQSTRLTRSKAKGGNRKG